MLLFEFLNGAFLHDDQLSILHLEEVMNGGGFRGEGTVGQKWWQYMAGWWCNNHLENMSSSMGRIIPYIMESKKCSKPPTSYIVAVVAWSNPVASTITTTTYQHQAFEEKCHPKIINQPSFIRYILSTYIPICSWLIPPLLISCNHQPTTIYIIYQLYPHMFDG